MGLYVWGDFVREKLLPYDICLSITSSLPVKEVLAFKWCFTTISCKISSVKTVDWRTEKPLTKNLFTTCRVQTSDLGQGLLSSACWSTGSSCLSEHPMSSDWGDVDFLSSAAAFTSAVFLRTLVRINNQSLLWSGSWRWSAARHWYMLQLYRNILNCVKSNV